MENPIFLLDDLGGNPLFSETSLFSAVLGVGKLPYISRIHTAYMGEHLKFLVIYEMMREFFMPFRCGFYLPSEPTTHGFWKGHVRNHILALKTFVCSWVQRVPKVY